MWLFVTIFVECEQNKFPVDNKIEIDIELK